jgi:hypothetical protein
MSETQKSLTKVQKLQLLIDDVKSTMYENLDKTIKRGDQIENLHDKTEELEKSAQDFKKKTSDLRKKMFWRNVKITMICIFIILAILAIIGIAIYFSVKT